MTNKNWMELGDVNPMEHGGIWVQEIEGGWGGYKSFSVVKWEPSEEEGEGMGWFSDSEVDMGDSWIDHVAVAKTYDWSSSTPNEIRAADIVGYYGAENFGSEAELMKASEAIELLKARDIVVNGTETI